MTTGCETKNLDDCTVSDEFIDAVVYRLHRRKDDPVIGSIHARLATLEELSSDMKEIKDWISTVVKVTRAMEWLVAFVSSFAVAAAKVSLAIGVVWVSVRMSAAEFAEFLRGLMSGFRGGK